jgi:hypothetical protein
LNQIPEDTPTRRDKKETSKDPKKELAPHRLSRLIGWKQLAFGLGLLDQKSPMWSPILTTVPPHMQTGSILRLSTRFRATAVELGGRFSNPSQLVKLRPQSSEPLTQNPRWPHVSQTASYLEYSQLTASLQLLVIFALNAPQTHLGAFADLSKTAPLVLPSY